MHCPLAGFVWQSHTRTGRVAPPVSADTVISPLEPTFTDATENTPVAPTPGTWTMPSLFRVAASATMSGTAPPADSRNVFTPFTTGAAGALSHSNTSSMSVGEIGAEGVNASTNVWRPNGGMVTGAFGLPVGRFVDLSVVWNAKVAPGTSEAGAIVHSAAVDAPLLMIVADAVAGTPTATDRAPGRTA